MRGCARVEAILLPSLPSLKTSCNHNGRSYSLAVVPSMAAARAWATQLAKKQRRMMRHMHIRAESAVQVAEHAVEAAASVAEAASAKWTLAGADQDLARQRKKQHDLDIHGIALMDNGGIAT